LTHSLEAAYFLLIILTFCQISKYYFLSSASSLARRQKRKLKQKNSKPYTLHHPTTNLNLGAQSLPPLDYYFYKLPEPEVSVSSEQDIIIVEKEIPRPILTTTPKNKTILNNYIDDFFSVAPPKRAQQSKISDILSYQVTPPEKNEVITLSEPYTEMV